MYVALLIIFLLAAIRLIGLIMLQQGKGADMELHSVRALLQLFGSSGSGNFMTRMTGILAAVFFIISLILGNMTANKYGTGSGSKWKTLVNLQSRATNRRSGSTSYTNERYPR